MTKEETQSKLTLLMSKSQINFEKHKYIKVTDPERYNEFRHGQTWGEIKAYSTIKQLLGQLDSE